MRVILRVGDARQKEAATTAWQYFEDVATPHPLDERADVTVEVAPLELSPGATANALWRPRVDRPVAPREELACFSLADGFFEREPLAQACILLHEAVHVRLYKGRMQNNYQAMRDPSQFRRLNLLLDTSEPGLAFIDWRRKLAVELLTLPQEVAVDKCLGTVYGSLMPMYLEDRWLWYTTNREGENYEGLPARLQPYLVFYRLVRAEIGLAVVEDPRQRSELENRRASQERALRDLVDEERLRWFMDLKVRLLAIDVGVRELDPNDYTELFESVSEEPASLVEVARLALDEIGRLHIYGVQNTESVDGRSCVKLTHADDGREFVVCVDVPPGGHRLSSAAAQFKLSMQAAGVA